ncbi:hypothetical protein [Aeoliella mucimassa]|nr:hypothetical protein [Aeoliella mucimassa]
MLTSFTRSFVRSLLCLMVICMLIGATGCGGCRNETPQQRQARLDKEAAEKKKKEEEERKRKEEEKKKQAFIVEPPVTKPSDTENQRSLAKRGHWMTVTQLMKSNKDDWGGDTTLQVTDSQGNPVPIELTAFTLSSTRPVALAKGRPRQVENVFLVPSTGKSASVRCTLRERNYGAVVGGLPLGAPLRMMESYQYFFVVLAKERNRYTFLKTLNGVTVPQSSDDVNFSNTDINHYQVLLPDISKQVPLPDNPLCWSTIAYILWDEVDPDQLDRQRREALIDWLHWGGQLVVNGPDSLKLLEGSFLAPYLPATDGGAEVITQDDIEALNTYWTSKSRSKTKPLKLTRDWSGIKLNMAEGVSTDEGLAAATGGLFVERQVGRGRIVLSRIQIAQRDLLSWSPHYDDFFNAGVMRRLPRTWRTSSFGNSFSDLHAEWAGVPDRMRDAQYVTNYRLFSRDVHDDPEATNQVIVSNDDAIDLKYEAPIPGGIGSWNDFNATSSAARESLRKAAGVRVPPASFVVNCLAVYLVVLVPLNWLFFKALGKVEYAWIAAPIIALIGTAVVVKQAQLDIGFVRAQTEIALLEVQGEYPRAHLSRYTALYTSLSTSYDAEFEDPNALAAPFPRGKDFRMLIGQSRSEMELAQNKTSTLHGMQVSSATTDMLHSEQMIALDGPILFERKSENSGNLVNQSQFKLQSVAIVRRSDKDGERRLLGSWVGSLDPKRSMTVSMVPLDENRFDSERKQENEQHADRLDLEPMFALALDSLHMEDGEVRLVARVDEVLPGVAVTPSAAQVRGAALVVAHLGNDALPLPVPDENSPLDVVDSSAPSSNSIDDYFGPDGL